MRIIDLYCGLGGWATGLLEQGHHVIGYDILDFSKDYPGEFIQADLTTLNTFPPADIITASPPCTEFSKASFPKTWKSVSRHPPNIPSALQLFNRVYEITGLIHPKYFIIENVRGAQAYTGKARQHIGSRYFWGIFPYLSPGHAPDTFGKWRMPPTPNRAALRSKIPLSISRSFANAILERTL